MNENHFIAHFESLIVSLAPLDVAESLIWFLNVPEQ